MKIDAIDGLYTEEDYREAIEALQRGMTQLAPDGHNCAICEDSGHQAWECHHNPLNAMKDYWGWRCFHCGRLFLDSEAAKEHFGTMEDDLTRYQRLALNYLLDSEREVEVDEL
jgi:hypothetical protein